MPVIDNYGEKVVQQTEPMQIRSYCFQCDAEFGLSYPETCPKCGCHSFHRMILPGKLVPQSKEHEMRHG